MNNQQKLKRIRDNELSIVDVYHTQGRAAADKLMAESHELVKSLVTPKSVRIREERKINAKQIT
jgi:hypothetical protein